MSVSRPGNMRGIQGKTPLLLLLLLLTTLAATGSCQDYADEDEADPQYDTDEQEPVADGDGETAEPTSSIPELPLTSALPLPTEGPGETDPYLVENTEDHGSALSPEIQQFHERELGESGKEILTLMEETSEHDWTEVTDDPNFTGPTSTPLDQEGLSPTIILVPVVLVVLIIGMIVCCIVINRRWNNKARNKGTSNIADSRKEDPYLDGSSTEKVPMPMFEEDVPSVLELEMEELDQWMKKDG